MTLLSRTLGLDLPNPRDVVLSLIKQQQEQQPSNDCDNIQEQEPTQEQSVNRTEVAKISYILQSNGNVTIVPSWNNESPQVASAFANLLFLINDGYVANETKNVLQIYAQHNICSMDFVNNTIKAWVKLFSHINHEAVLRPSLVLKASRVLPKRKPFLEDDDE